MAQEVDSLTVKVVGKDDDRISADSLLKVIRETLSVLANLDKKSSLTWKLKNASFNGPLLMTFVAEPKPGVAEWSSDLSSKYLDMLLRLDRGDGAGIPAAFKAAKRAQKLVDVLNDGVSQITFSSPRHEPVTPTRRIQATVAEFVEERRSQYMVFTTLEGVLKKISAPGGDKFFLYDRLTGFGVECTVATDRIEEAKTLLNKRASVQGNVRYVNGRPRFVEVDEFEPFPERSELPQFKDIQGIDVTDGLDSVEFVRGRRDAE